MNRRDFLARSAAVAIVPAIPFSTAPVGELTVAHLLKAKAMLMRNALRPEWGVGPAQYAIADLVTFNKRVYRCLETC